MKRIVYRVYAVGLICLATVTGCEKRGDTATDLTAPAYSGNTVEETKTADVMEKRRPSHADFQKSYELYGQKKYNEAADYMRQGNASLKGELSTVQGELKQEAVDVVREITLLVGDVRKGKVTSPKALQGSLGRAQRIVAQNYLAQAQDNLERQPPAEIANQVDLSLKAFENSYAYGNDRVPAGMQPLIDQTRLLVQNPQSMDRRQVAAQLQKLSGALSAGQSGGKAAD